MSEYIVKVLKNREVETVGELVRCKDCRYWRSVKGESMCTYSFKYAWPSDENGYCSHGIKGEAEA